MSHGNKIDIYSLVNDIRAGVDQTFTTMLKTKPTSLPEQIVPECRLEGDVSGLISIVGQDINGTLILTFPRETILALLETIYHRKMEAVNPSVKSGVGELTNIVFGLFKTSLNNKGFGIKMAIPNIILGEQHTVISLGTGDVMMIPFMTEKGGFSVMIGLGEAELNRPVAQVK